MVQWLRLHAPNAGGLSLIPGQGTRFWHATTKNSNARTKDSSFLSEYSVCHNQDLAQANKYIKQTNSLKKNSLLYISSKVLQIVTAHIYIYIYICICIYYIYIFQGFADCWSSAGQFSLVISHVITVGTGVI